MNLLSIGEGTTVLDKKTTTPKMVAKATFLGSKRPPEDYHLYFSNYVLRTIKSSY